MVLYLYLYFYIFIFLYLYIRHMSLPLHSRRLNGAPLSLSMLRRCTDSVFTQSPLLLSDTNKVDNGKKQHKHGKSHYMSFFVFLGLIGHQIFLQIPARFILAWSIVNWVCHLERLISPFQRKTKRNRLLKRLFSGPHLPREGGYRDWPLYFALTTLGPSFVPIWCNGRYSYKNMFISLFSNTIRQLSSNSRTDIMTLAETYKLCGEQIWAQIDLKLWPT